jgi:hypothetical protein
MAADLSYQNDPRWGSFSEEEQKAYNKQTFNKDYDQLITDKQKSDYRDTAQIAYDFSKKKIEDTRAQQEALNRQQQEYRQQDESRDYQQAQQAYKY